MLDTNDFEVKLEAQHVKAIAEGRSHLLEYDAREILTSYGVPFLPYRMTTTNDEALSAAKEVGFPVALKAIAANVLHKTEAGAVVLDIADSQQLASACREMRSRLGADLVGFIVERMARPGLDLLIGVTTDPVFGHVVGLGLGGTLVEFHAVVEFRQVPLSSDDAWALVNSERLRLKDRRLRQYRLTFGAFLHDTLLRVAGPGGLMVRGSRFIDALELNPVRVNADGLVALDAKITLRHEIDGTSRYWASAALSPDLTDLFRPKSIAYFGASPDPAKIGTRILQSMMDFGFQGPIHVVHPTADAIVGMKCIKSLKEADVTVDYAYIALPRAMVPVAVEDCAGRAKFAHILTSGFGEYSDEGRLLQREFVNSALAGGVRLIGPNCIGLYSPAGRVTCIEEASPKPGRVAFVSQSGGLATDAIRTGPTLGLYYSKVVSIGNCADLDAADFVEHLVKDKDTDVIGIYVEAVHDGSRFLNAVGRAVAEGKPVIVLKGGRSARGARAAALHTDSIVTNHEVWEGALRQHGAIPVDTFEDLLDALAFLQNNAIPVGDRALVIGQGGGATVLVADDCDRLGLALPTLEASTTDALLRTGLFPSVIPENPIDSPVGVLQAKEGRALGEIISLILSREQFSILVIHINLQNVFAYTREPEIIIANAIDGLVTAKRQYGIPMIVVFRANGEPKMESVRVNLQMRATDQGLAVAPTTGAALKLAQLMLKLSSDVNASSGPDEMALNA